MDSRQTKKAILDELNLVNTECHTLRGRVAELAEENARLSAELFATRHWAAHVGAVRRTQTHILGMALDLKDAAASVDYLAFPKFVAHQAVTAANALGQKLAFSRR